jgi:DNA-binding response OmpR family regulator
MDKKTILVVEDDNIVGPMYQAALEGAGYNAVLAKEGARAWHMIQEYSPDLMLLDIAMPNVNGLELLKLLKDDQTAKDTIIIIVSNLAKEKEMQKCLELGAKDFKVKAEWKIADMLKEVKEYLKD